MTNVYCAWAQKHHFDEIHTVDIIDCNAGDHGKAFATNFNPEINIREITQPRAATGRTASGSRPILDDRCVHQFRLRPRSARKEMLPALPRGAGIPREEHPRLKRIRFWMTFGQNYLTHLRVLQNVGMTCIEPIDYEGQENRPAAVPEGPAARSRVARHQLHRQGGDRLRIQGDQRWRGNRKYIYNVCDHAEAYQEVGSQAISYTTGVPAMIGAMMMLTGIWKGPGCSTWNSSTPTASWTN